MSETTSSTPTSLYKWNLAAYVVNVFITYGVGVVGLFDLPTNSENSQKYQTLVTPIGWAFAIWGVIFLLQAIFVLYPFVVSVSERNKECVQAVDFDYVWVVVAQAGWTLTFSKEMILASTFCMLAIFHFLWKIVFALKLTGNRGFFDYLVLKLPFTLHAGWITAATLVQLNLLLVAFQVAAKWQWYAGIFSLAILFIVALMQLKQDIVIPAVLAWAAYGISKELANPSGMITDNFHASEIQEVQYCASIVTAIVAVFAVLRLLVLAFRICTVRDGHSTNEAAPLR